MRKIPKLEKIPNIFWDGNFLGRMFVAVIPSSSVGKTRAAFTVLACLVICIFNRDLMDHVQNLSPLKSLFPSKEKVS